MKNKEKGAVTMAIFMAMLIFSLYGIVFYGNSASSYIRQARMIEAIKADYAKDIPNAYQIAESLENRP